MLGGTVWNRPLEHTLPVMPSAKHRMTNSPSVTGLGPAMFFAATASELLPEFKVIAMLKRCVVRYGEPVVAILCPLEKTCNDLFQSRRIAHAMPLQVIALATNP